MNNLGSYEISPCGFLEDLLVQRQVRDRTAQPLVLLLKRR